MITYVNTVLVSNKGGDTLATKEELAGKQNKGDLKELVGKLVFMNCDAAAQDGSNIEDIYAVDENKTVLDITRDKISDRIIFVESYEEALKKVTR